ncbi:hypothetical protein HNQ77_004079 [Silvibacterium bohemicum]|jgi:hypothetical protein|uniref:Uncharacterized protein n=1 Tax=Silvibacterium bohemicum TaxID=1577686 RepID=A0A841K2G4_9BACT|nr:hypothetical protein [Silvibacterium bohemicum]MBB6146109.1 hypothetical protein [Silvibacterium bohemicum]
MILPIISTASITGMVAYAIYWRRQQAQRRTADWDSIVSRLRSNSEFNFSEVTDRYLYSDEINATPADVWKRIDGANGLWAMYTNAGVLMELADYATEHGEDVPEQLIEELRSDALQLRMAVVISLVKYAFSRSGVAASVHAHRAATAYSAMLAHMTTLFQEHSALYFPRFLEAM